MWKHKRTISRVTRHLVSGIKDNARTLSTSSWITITTHMCTLWIALTTKYEAEIHFHLAKVCVSTPPTTITLSLVVPCATYARLGHCHFGPMENMEDAIMLSYRLNCTCFAIQDTRARKFLGCVNIPWIYLAGIGRSVFIARAQCMVISKQNFHNKCNIIIVLVIFDHKETYEWFI